MSSPLLSFAGVSANYGEFSALHDVTFSVDPGEVVALLGSNGAGKSTIARVASGLLVPRAGVVSFDGSAIAGEAPHKLARQGLVHLNEGRSIFSDLTVEENLTVARSTTLTRRERRRALPRLFDQFGALRDRREQRAGSLSGGEQRLLAIMRALLDPPRLLVADELSLGLSPVATTEVYVALGELAAKGCAMVLIEQRVDHVVTIAPRALVVDRGAVSFDGPSSLALDHLDLLVRGRDALQRVTRT